MPLTTSPEGCCGFAWHRLLTAQRSPLPTRPGRGLQPSLARSCRAEAEPASSEQDSGGPLPGQAYGNPHLRAVFSPCSMQRAPRPSESLGPGPQSGLSGALVRSARA